MTTALPTQITYGTFNGKLIDAINTGGGEVARAVTGTVTATPQVNSVNITAALLVMFAHPVTVTLDTTGAFTMQLVATDDPALSVLNWAYQISFQLNNGDTLAPFLVQIPGGSTVDLSTANPVSTGGGVAITRGPAGIQGDPGAGAPDATATAKGSIQLAGDLSGTAAAPTVPGKASKTYVQSRGQNLVTNGTGLLGDNTNFPGFTFDAADLASGSGSFKASGPSAALFSGEVLPVDPTQTYELALLGKAGDVGGANYYPNNIHYTGIATYDADGLVQLPSNYQKFAGSTDTTLAAALVPGATTVTLTSAVGWQNAGPAYQRQFCWYGYANAKGYTYPDYTYTRNLGTDHVAGALGAGVWAAGGIAGNVITLTAPWNGPMIPAGVAVRNNQDGSAYKYLGVVGVPLPNSWTKYWGRIGGYDVNGAGSASLFPYGTASAGLVFLINNGVATGAPAAANTVRYNNVTFSQVPSRFGAINLLPGPAPAAPVNGDMWTTAAGLFVFVNGITTKLA